MYAHGGRSDHPPTGPALIVDDDGQLLQPVVDLSLLREGQLPSDRILVAQLPLHDRRRVLYRLLEVVVLHLRSYEVASGGA